MSARKTSYRIEIESKEDFLRRNLKFVIEMKFEHVEFNDFNVKSIFDVKCRKSTSITLIKNSFLISSSSGCYDSYTISWYWLLIANACKKYMYSSRKSESSSFIKYSQEVIEYFKKFEFSFLQKNYLFKILYCLRKKFIKSKQTCAPVCKKNYVL